MPGHKPFIRLPQSRKRICRMTGTHHTGKSPEKLRKLSLPRRRIQRIKNPSGHSSCSIAPRGHHKDSGSKKCSQLLKECLQIGTLRPESTSDHSCIIGLDTADTQKFTDFHKK